MTVRSAYFAFHGPPDFVNDGTRIRAKATRPHPDDAVPSSLQPEGVPDIPVHITTESALPVLGAGGRGPVVLRASVPETAVHENGDPCTEENHVGGRTRRAQVLSVPHPGTPEQATEPDLGFGAGATDSPHVTRSGGGDGGQIVESLRTVGLHALPPVPSTSTLTGRIRAPGGTIRTFQTRPVVADLFAGAGLFSAAFDAEGFFVQQAVEMDSTAAQTYRAQLGDHVEVADVRAVSPSKPFDVLVAGPPCQGFSTLGKRDPADPRNRLSMEVVRWTALGRPSVVVVENVAAFLEAPVWMELAEGLRQLGYEVSSVVLDAAGFSVAQRRLRSFTVASRVGTPRFPVPGTATTTVRAAWEGLPYVPDGKNLHVSPAPTALALERMRVIPAGGNKLDVMERAPHLAPPSWWRIGTQAGDVWGRMHWDAPSNTLRTCLQDPSKGRCIHPEQDRVMSLREAARLHSIPDEWTFAGAPQRIARQIGNSVPPRLGRAMAREVAALLGF